MYDVTNEVEVGLDNQSGLEDSLVIDALRTMPELAHVERFVKGWGGSSRRRNSTIFNQDRYTIPEGIFDQMRVAYDAARYDDIVSGFVKSTEELAFKRVKIDCGDDNVNNIVDQIMDDVNLVGHMREIWREISIVSQCYIAVRWGRRDLKVKGIAPSGRPNKKSYKNLLVPVGLSILDPLKIIPVGNFLFNNERLVYIADDIGEATDIYNTIAERNTSDLIVNDLFESRYSPRPQELSELQDLVGFSSDLPQRLFLLREDAIWRITATRPSYQRFADIEMMSVAELLDLKHNLRESDRSDILGNLNCIVLVKKGSDDLPAQAAELEGVKTGMERSARNSLIVSDHRIDIEIITKKTDHTLQAERHNMLDARITSRLFQTLMTGNYASGTALDDSTKLFKVIAALMESRRDDIRDSLMDHMIDLIWAKNEDLDGEPKMSFFPRRIALDFDPNYAQTLMELYATGDISRETILSEFDLDQAEEAARRKREKELYDDILTPKLLPGQGLTPEQEGRSGGGNSNGGGANKDSGKPSPSNQPKKPRESDVKKSTS
jgi:hypothetical protein